MSSEQIDVDLLRSRARSLIIIDPITALKLLDEANAIVKNSQITSIGKRVYQVYKKNEPIVLEDPLPKRAPRF